MCPREICCKLRIFSRFRRRGKKPGAVFVDIQISVSGSAEPVIVAIMQPAYLPWLGYFHRIACSDIHVVLDDVSIDHNSKTKFANRNKVRTKDGWSWLTVPLKTSGRSSEMLLNSIEVADDPRWSSKHWETIRCSYAKAPSFAAHRDFFAATYSQRWTRLQDLVRSTTDYLREALDCPQDSLQFRHTSWDLKPSDQRSKRSRGTDLRRGQ